MHQHGGISESETRQVYGLLSSHKFLPLFEEAACYGLDTEIFFYDISSGRHNRYQIATAKAICAGCPVLEKCRDFALAIPGIHGIWGGTTDRERMELRRIMRTNAKAG